MKYKIMEYDDVLKLYEADLDLRVNDYHKKREELIGANGSIVDFANGHEYFGIHRTSEGWVTVSGHRALLRCIWQVRFNRLESQKTSNGAFRKRRFRDKAF